MDLLPHLDPSSQIPLYQQLYACFERQIAAGELPVGERLPATRELAGLLGVNRTTVSAAYEMLEQKGLISGQVGRGSFVAGRAPAAPLDWSSLLSRPARQFTVSALSNPAAISFAASRPPEELFPVEDFQRSCEDVLAGGNLDSILQLGSAGGYEPLRNYLVEEARREGVLGSEDDLLITSGCQQALDLLRRVLVKPGTRVAVEDPVYPGLKNILMEGGAQLVNYERFPARIAFLTPNFQNPTGLTMTLAERQRVVKEARDNGTVLVENDIYSALRYVGDALPSLKQLAPRMGITLIRSFSKIAFPGLRLGWVIGPRPLITALRETKQLTDLHSDQFSQAVMLRFAESGRLAEHQARLVDAGRERLQAALEAAEKFFPEGSRWTRPEGGLNFWVTLPEGLDAGRLLERSQREGVAYLPGEVFRVERPQHRSLRISFGGTRPEQITRGIETLGRVFRAESEVQRQAEREPVPALV
jgi:2-aminoadipate transaminase